MSIPSNPKSDVDAKAAFVVELSRRGFDTVKVTRSPADITAVRNGVIHYYEVKYTARGDLYFGAATLTEWEAAISNEANFTFVVALRKNGRWVFHEYTPREFMEFSTIPPFKAYFSVTVTADKDTRTRGRTKSVRLTRDRIAQMVALYQSFRDKRP